MCRERTAQTMSQPIPSKAAVAQIGMTPLATVPTLSREMLTTDPESKALLAMLGVPILRLGTHEWFSVHALELSLARLLDPQTPPDQLPSVGALYLAQRRAMIYNRLKAISHGLMGKIRKRKSNRTRIRKFRGQLRSRPTKVRGAGGALPSLPPVLTIQ